MRGFEVCSLVQVCEHAVMNVCEHAAVHRCECAVVDTCVCVCGSARMSIDLPVWQTSVVICRDEERQSGPNHLWCSLGDQRERERESKRGG